MAEPRLLERLTASDLFMLLWDDYGWSTDIGALAILDGTSLLDRDGHLRIEAVRQRLEPRLAAVPRFRQLLSRPRLGLGWPLWVDAPCFDLADHVRVHALGAPADEAQLLEACQELARRRLDPARPLTRPSCLRHASNWPGGWIRPGRCGSCGCCPASPSDGWARSCGCTTPSPTAPRQRPPSRPCWT